MTDLSSLKTVGIDCSLPSCKGVVTESKLKNAVNRRIGIKVDNYKHLRKVLLKYFITELMPNSNVDVDDMKSVTSESYTEENYQTISDAEIEALDSTDTNEVQLDDIVNEKPEMNYTTPEATPEADTNLEVIKKIIEKPQAMVDDLNASFAAPPQTAAAPNKPDLIDKTLAQFTEHLEKPGFLVDLAKQAVLSPEKMKEMIISCFNSKTGESRKQYVYAMLANIGQQQAYDVVMKYSEVELKKKFTEALTEFTQNCLMDEAFQKGTLLNAGNLIQKTVNNVDFMLGEATELPASLQMSGINDCLGNYSEFLGLLFRNRIANDPNGVFKFTKMTGLMSVLGVSTLASIDLTLREKKKASETAQLENLKRIMLSGSNRLQQPNQPKPNSSNGSIQQSGGSLNGVSMPPGVTIMPATSENLQNILMQHVTQK